MSRPKIGLALGSGGARGIAHFGVVKVLQEAGISFDFIAGSSMGSIVGVLLANGADMDLCGKLIGQLKVPNWIDLSMPKKGFIQGVRIKELIRLLTHEKNLEQLEIPTAVVATDLQNGERVIFTEGPIDEAVRASISIPGVFEPVYHQGRILTDGGVIDRVPISVVRDMGADFVIAVDVIPRVHEAKIENIFDVMTQTLSIMQREILSQQMLTADFLFHPHVGDFSATSFRKSEVLIERGRVEAEKHITQLKNLLMHWQGERISDALEKME
ncbi:patatin-like phospholipase family protein [Hazenella sp. IB182357]|uniref:Patatin-like phospholipase family protein n=1 Tax=Polycladospora coralii TaxID=2771432 RepID=A0A926RTI6_9BACL|nr:patatin-like phospholipase family protein [Polycladospora coralii]MBD1371402.1 patatin-like phospholipase family protein [Polycladospora coralii]MBS7530370.1 patatin-like phospholipase family protein [Polycladospora coralii]